MKESHQSNQDPNEQPQTWMEKNFPMLLVGGMVLAVVLMIALARYLPK
jgi:hypothetical protein